MEPKCREAPKELLAPFQGGGGLTKPFAWDRVTHWWTIRTRYAMIYEEAPEPTVPGRSARCRTVMR